MASSGVEIKVGGRRFDGWKSVELTRGIDALAGFFTVKLTERWPGQPDHWGIEGGDACEVLIDGEKVMTGWIDAPSWSLASATHPVVITGVEKTTDLVDCSAIHTPGSWKKRKLEQIATDLAAPFGITVTAKADTGAAFPTFALNQGETVFEAINRMARLRGVLVVSTPDGDVELIHPGKTPAGYTLAVGDNIEDITFTNRHADRFSEYLLKGYGADAKSRPKATAKDAGVARYRPLLIIEDGEASQGSLAARAKFEATVRAGRGQQVKVTCSGWRAASGELFRPDRLVPVRARQVGVEGELLLYSVTYRFDESGRRAELALAPKEAFSLEPIPAPKARRRRATPPPGGL
ncbi:hypothetical protein GVN21_19525 [Caulobacter sp. SLTY]|uniref:phage baseplate assembly protein n=1 Tax=Caulobacter sp. SLTY TaxID=2683262 RepID=UPI0014130125|nr:hypothetical protein [Caulobacter sp. SLTY]NBB17558.1 hypothetical protein [Caulobacter sp. SLTY]